MTDRRLSILEHLALAARDGNAPPALPGVDLRAFLRGFIGDRRETGMGCWFQQLPQPATLSEVARRVADVLGVDLDRPAREIQSNL